MGRANHAVHRSTHQEARLHLAVWSNNEVVAFGIQQDLGVLRIISEVWVHSRIEDGVFTGVICINTACCRMLIVILHRRLRQGYTMILKLDEILGGDVVPGRTRIV